MSCTAYRLYNGTSSPITQSFDDCNGGSCSVVVPSGATKYYITAESSTFIPDPAFTLVTTYSGNTRAFSFSSCCTNDVFYILGDITTLSPNQIGRTICVNELTNPNDCTINNTLVKGCYEFVSIESDILLALGNQVYLEYLLGFDDCEECFDSWVTMVDGCIPCCKCYQIDNPEGVSCTMLYTDCDRGTTGNTTFTSLTNYICSATIPYGMCGDLVTVTDLGPCSTTEPCGPCYSSYCITNTGKEYDDNYTLDGNYDGYSYWISSSGTYYIYYNTIYKQWCLSDSLGGSCLLSGKSPCFSECPDLCEEYFFEGVCPTTTTTTVACVTFDFDAIFDCLAEQTPTPTPTPTVTPTITVTPTPTNYCSMVSVDATIDTYSPTPTPTPTVTPTSSGIITRPCNVLGDVSFTTLEGHIGCPSSKQFQDCVTGMMYYTTELVPTPSGDTLTEFMIFKAYVDNVLKCISFVGINDNIIGVNTIELVEGPTGYSNLGECVLCDVIPSSTPTPTPTMTPTPSGTPCFCYELIAQQQTTFNYIDCNGSVTTATSAKAIPTYVCSLSLPTTTSLFPYSITKLGICVDGVCPPVTCNCYTVSNGGPKVGLLKGQVKNDAVASSRNSYSESNTSVKMVYTDCDNVVQVVVINAYTTTAQFCSLTTPFVTSSTNIITITLLGDCSSCFPPTPTPTPTPCVYSEWEIDLGSSCTFNLFDCNNNVYDTVTFSGSGTYYVCSVYQPESPGICALPPTIPIVGPCTPTPTPPIVPLCGVIYNSPTNIYSYDFTTNTSTLLTLPGPFLISDISHTINKLWLISGTMVNEWDITLSPFTAVFNRTITLPHNTGPGLGAIDDTTLIAVNNTVVPNQVVTLDITTPNVVSTYKFDMMAGRTVAGDLLKTTTDKVLITNYDGSYTQYITQYDFNTGLVDVDIILSPTITSPWGIAEDSGNIYVFNGSSTTNNVFNIDVNSPYALSVVGSTGYSVYGASQVPTCINTHFNLV